MPRIDLKDSTYVSTAWFIEGENPIKVIEQINNLIVKINHDENNPDRFVKDIKVIFDSEGKLTGVYVLEGAVLSYKPNLMKRIAKA